MVAAHHDLEQQIAQAWEATAAQAASVPHSPRDQPQATAVATDDAACAAGSPDATPGDDGSGSGSGSGSGDGVAADQATRRNRQRRPRVDMRPTIISPPPPRYVYADRENAEDAVGAGGYLVTAPAPTPGVDGDDHSAGVVETKGEEGACTDHGSVPGADQAAGASPDPSGGTTHRNQNLLMNHRMRSVGAAPGTTPTPSANSVAAASAAATASAESEVGDVNGPSTVGDEELTTIRRHLSEVLLHLVEARQAPSFKVIRRSVGGLVGRETDFESKAWRAWFRAEIDSKLRALLWMPKE